jgi:hypothetical protein
MKYRDKNDKNFLLDLVYNWKYDYDTDMLVSDGVSADFVRLCCLAIVAVFAVICF